MRCRCCGGSTKVVYTKFCAALNEVHRRRECLNCKTRFISAERFDHEVRKHGGKKDEPVKKQSKKHQVEKVAKPKREHKKPCRDRYDDHFDTRFFEEDCQDSLSDQELRGLGIDVSDLF